MGKKKPTSVKSKKPATTEKPKTEEEEFGFGTALKDGSGYRQRIKANIASMPGHPRKQGVQMQAHHLISQDAVQKHLPERARLNIEYFNYNINCLENLAYLPCTPQGACHLGVQLHCGNHTAIGKADAQDAAENDRHIERSYHDVVAEFLLEIAPLVKGHCAGEMSREALRATSVKICSELNTVSLTVLRLIQKKPQEAPLTKLYPFFQPGNPVGCGGVDSVNGHKDHSQHTCPVGRNHLKRQGDGQRSESIKYSSTERYVLKVGQ